MNPRPRKPLALLLSTLLVATVTQPQLGAQRSPHRIMGLVRSDGGRPLDKAAMTFYPAPTPRLSILSAYADLTAGPLAPIRDFSKPGGRFQLRVPSQTGALLALYPPRPPARLGALRLGDQATGTLGCRPVAELAFARACDLWIQAVAVDGRCYHLGKRTAVQQLRLPAGEYRFLVQEGNDKKGKILLYEFRQHLRSGTRTQAPTAPPIERRVNLSYTDATVSLRDWPQLALPRSGGGWAYLRCTEAPVRLLARHGSCLTEFWASKAEVPVTRGAKVEMGLALYILDPDGTPIPDAVVTIAEQTASGWSLHAQSHTDQTGRTDMPSKLESGWVFVWARGYATSAQAVDETKQPDQTKAEIRLRTGTKLQLRVLDQRGEPVAGAILEAIPQQALLRSPHRTDHLGQLSLSDLPAGQFEVQLLDPRYRPSRVPTVLRPDISNRLTIRADPGALLHGQVLLPDGKPAPRAVISLRGTHHQVTIAKPDGTFQVRGLSDTDTLRISARLTHQGAAYISTNLMATPGETKWILQLKSEDPSLPGRRKN
ncbi:MAG: carboxypeptidase-like regulatory domain-containing protein [Planctomycetota bacterium]|nr:carboxypeptidase-like regulatory domain-containing protein [Planctomycetota bacterium]